MNHVEVEGHKILNLDLVEVVEMNHRTKKATAWNAGVNIVVDSSILYRLYKTVRLLDVPPEEKIQVGQPGA